MYLGGYGQKFFFHDLYDQIKRELHLTDLQIHKQFPDICHAKFEESRHNLGARNALLVLIIKRLER